MVYDIIIVGGGPAGMTAALYSRRNGRSVLLIEKNSFGGQITHSPRVENYPGIAQMSGNEYADSLLSQILDHGSDIEYASVNGIRQEDNLFYVETDDGTCFTSRSVILATGVKHRTLGLEGESDLTGNGISYCAVCDGDFFAGEEVCIVGGGNSALQDALLLSGKCSHVTIMQDLPVLTAEHALQEKIRHRDNISCITSAHIENFVSDNDGLNGICYTKDGKTGTIRCKGLFVAIGLIPENTVFSSLADLDQLGYFNADERCLTKTPGLFVAGDCRQKNVRQLTTAVCDGAVAAVAASRYLDTL